ncbi:MAG: serine/threonine-protein kinase [Polyangiaceae bacterium]
MPERLGAFEIERVLGEGGSAVVYAARDGDREVALKVLHPELVLDEKQVERFLGEAERMRKVEHRALVPVLGAGCLPGGRPFIVMPRLVGATLAERLASLEGGGVPMPRALVLFEELAGAVAALHAAGLVHRDIKPENVLWLDAEDRLVLLDLGIARETQANPSTTTKAGFMRGTPAYMAPERFFGGVASVRSDVYELALLLYILVAGRPPWDDGDPAGRVSPSPRPEDAARFSPAMLKVLLAALDFDAQRRPASVAALMGRVRAAASAPQMTPTSPPVSSPTVSRPISAPQSWALGQSTPEPSIATSIAMQATERMTPVIAAGARSSPPAAPPAPQAAARPRSTRGARFAIVGGATIVVLGGAAFAASGALKTRAEAPISSPTATSVSASATVAANASSTIAPAQEPGIVVVTVTATMSASSPALPPPDDSAVAQPSVQQPSSSAIASSRSAPARVSASAAVGAPTSQSALTTATSSSSPSAAPATPPICSNFVALMCSPTSGARPEECTAWRQQVREWVTTLPSNVAADVCKSAFDASSNGLALRRAAMASSARPPGAPSSSAGP